MQQHVSIVHVPGGTPIKSGVDTDILHETLESCGFSILAHTPAEYWASLSNRSIDRKRIPPIQGVGVESDIPNGKRSGYRNSLLPQNACKHHFCDDLFKVGSGGYFGMADSAHSDPGLTGTPDSRKCTGDDE